MKSFYQTGLKASTSLSTPTTIKVLKPTTVIRAVSIGTSDLTDDQRVQGAAQWLNGDAIVLPTLTLATHTFKTNYAAVVAARGQPGNRPKLTMWLKLIFRCWMNLSEAERSWFCSVNEADVWQALEQATDRD